MRAFVSSTALFLTLALVIPASAGHCNTWSSASPEIDAAGFYYVDYDPAPPKGLGALWVYAESNGIAGLQRGDEVRDTTCHGMIDADTIII